jgi:hypothetical protein
MTMATAFPFTLPRPMRMGYGYQVGQPHAETPNDRGLGRRRRLGIGSTTTATLAWRFTQTELQTFAQWWRDDIAYGTADFSIQLLNGYDDVAQDVRPKGAYSASRLDGVWDVTLPVELVAPPIATQTVMQDAIDNYDDLALADQFHYLVHTTIPWSLS